MDHANKRAHQHHWRFGHGSRMPVALYAAPRPGHPVSGLKSRDAITYNANNQFACGEGCLSQERLESVVTTTLAGTDFNVLPGSAHTVGATTQAARDSVLAAFTAKIDVDLKRSEEREEEEGEGQIRVTLFGGPVFDVLPCAESASSTFNPENPQTLRTDIPV